MLIGWSVVMHGAAVGKLQYVGYAIAFAGVTGYTQYKRELAGEEERGKAALERRRLLEDELDIGEDEEDDEGFGSRR